MLDQRIFGEMERSGRIVRDVTTCAYTGLKITPGDVIIPVGHNHFYRIKGSLNRRAEVRGEVEEKYRDQMGLEPAPEGKL